jgi:hypothetical protein
MIDHPIAPPLAVVNLWRTELYGCPKTPGEFAMHIAKYAAQWGADQELKACCELMDDWGLEASDLRTVRRPSPSLKEQALKTLEASAVPDAMTMLEAHQHALIRRALEALPDD